MASTSGGGSDPRPALDPEVIIDASLRLARKPDPSAMSFRALGRELGVDPTAIYRHFQDRNELLEAALDRLMLDVVAAVRPEGPWRDRLRAHANAYLEVIVTHPVIGAEAGHRRTGGPGEFALLEVLLSALAEAGLSPEQVGRYFPLLAGYAAAMAATQAALRLQDDRVQEASERAWIATQALMDADRYPTAMALRDPVSRLRDADVFWSGYELLLDAVVAASET
ncbi:MAG: TetR/AcrR family transcriptional regulator [Nitriliruptoraceae bacterium]